LPSTKHDRTLHLVAQAWLNRRVLRCEFRPPRRRQHHPHEDELRYYELNRRNLQPDAAPRDRPYFGRVGVFRLPRMRNARLLRETYAIPADFAPVAYLESAWGVTVVGEPVEGVLRVDPSVASWFLEQQEVDRNVEVASEGGDGALEVVLRGRL